MVCVSDSAVRIQYLDWDLDNGVASPELGYLQESFVVVFVVGVVEDTL